MFGPIPVTLQEGTKAAVKNGLSERYETLCAKSKLLSFWAWFMGKSTDLQTLQTESERYHIANRHYAGLQTVDLTQIRGSENGNNTFDAEFRPKHRRNRHRWVELALAWKADVPLPPVSLIKLGETYFVRDGHHRVSVAREFGHQFIDADVTVWETKSPAAPQLAISKPTVNRQCIPAKPVHCSAAGHKCCC